MGRKRDASELNPLLKMIGRVSMKVKILLTIIIAISSLVILSFFFLPHHMFIASETSHALGILVLIYKLTKKKSCSGLSLKSQELTAIFLGTRLYCSLDTESNIHTLLDFASLVATAWVIYMIRFKLKSTYLDELDNMPLYYTFLTIKVKRPESRLNLSLERALSWTWTWTIVKPRKFQVVPCAIFALLVHPGSEDAFISNRLWAFCIYLESVSVLPQLRVMQNAKMVEPFTGHYVFALGIARFLGFANWIIEVIRSQGRYLFVVSSGYFWIPMAFLAEIVQTFILADFCYYYTKNVIYNQRLVSMSVPV